MNDFIKFNCESLDVSLMNGERFIFCKKLSKRRYVIFVHDTKGPFVNSVYSMVKFATMKHPN